MESLLFFAVIDWNHIFVAALLGGLGALVGYKIGSLVGGKAKFYAQIIFTVSLVTIASSFSSEISNKLPFQIFPQTQQVEAEIDKLFEEDPAFKIIFEDYPQIKPVAKQRLSAAYERGGMDEVTNEAGILGQESWGKYFINYLPLASDEDTIDLVKTSLEVLRILRDSDPELCYDWLFPGSKDIGVRFAKGVPDKLSTRMVESFKEIIINSRSQREINVSSLDDYNVELEEVVISVNQSVSPDLLNWEAMSPEIALPTDLEKRQACVMATAMYTAVLELPEDIQGGFIRALLTDKG